MIFYTSLEQTAPLLSRRAPQASAAAPALYTIGIGTRHDEHPYPLYTRALLYGVYDTERAKDLGRVAVCACGSRYDFGAAAKTAPLLSNGVFPRQCWPLVDLYLGGMYKDSVGQKAHRLSAQS